MRVQTTIVLALTLCALNAAAQTTTQPKPCLEIEQKQLDFWVGNWELSWPGSTSNQTQHGTNRIGRIMDGCVVQENFSGGSAMPLRGMSVSMFNARIGKWQQTWVDNQGGYLDFVGEFKDGQMILGREATGPNGAKILQRMVWKNIKQNEFDWSWESSKDGGKTWQVMWPIHYQRKSS